MFKENIIAIIYLFFLFVLFLTFHKLSFVLKHIKPNSEY